MILNFSYSQKKSKKFALVYFFVVFLYFMILFDWFLAFFFT